jgi:hypothetical protein
MKITVYLHIGTNKTGTTAIQRWLSAHRKELCGRGLLYPTTGMPLRAHHTLASALGFNLRVQTSDYKQAAHFRNKLDAEIRDSNASRVIISSENFCITRPTEPVRLFFKGLGVRIVVYLRRHDSWWESAYAQAVKMVAQPPYQCGFEHFLRFQRRQHPKFPNYRDLVDRWAYTFGWENVMGALRDCSQIAIGMASASDVAL